MLIACPFHSIVTEKTKHDWCTHLNGWVSLDPFKLYNVIKDTSIEKLSDEIIKLK